MDTNWFIYAIYGLLAIEYFAIFKVSNSKVIKLSYLAVGLGVIFLKTFSFALLTLTLFAITLLIIGWRQKSHWATIIGGVVLVLLVAVVVWFIWILPE